MATQIQLRRGTAAQWTSANTILASGEQGLETDTNKIKIGDGTTAWTSLAYFSTGSGGSASNATTTTPGLVQLAGDLAGTATAPTVAKLNGLTISGTPASGKYLDGSGAWLTLPSGSGGSGSSTPLSLVNVRDYGAVGNGSTSDVAAINAAINAIKNRSVGGDHPGVVYFPAGIYACPAQITVPINVRLIGETGSASRILMTGGSVSGTNSDGTMKAFVTVGASQTINTYGGIEDLVIDAQTNAPTALLMYGPQEGCLVSGSLIEGGTVRGIELRAHDIVGGTNKLVIDRCWIWTYGDTGMAGIWMDNYNGWMTVSNTTFVGINRSSQQGGATGSAGIMIGPNSSVNLQNNNFEHWDSAVIVDQGSLTADGITGFYVNYGITTTAASTSLPIFLTNAGFDGGTTTAVIRDQGSNITIPYCRTYWNEAYPYAPFHFERNIWSLGAASIATKAGGYGAQIGYDTPLTNSDTTRVKFTVNTGGSTWKEAASIDSAGYFGASDSAYNGQHLRIGAYHLWIDSNGRLRVKNSTPSSDTDGTIVGTQA